MNDIRRRDLIATGAALLVASSTSTAAAFAPKAKRSLRFAYATDPHVQPEGTAPAGWAACLKHLGALKDRPEMLMTGGDLIMDAFGATPERTAAQWEVFTKGLQEHVKIPVRHTLGNHDVFGWANPDKYASDKRYGKAWACEVLGMEKPYYSFDQGGWHFIVLDSTFPAGKGYTAKLDEEQFAWLEADLARTPKTTPVIVSSHIPILMVCAIFDGENEKTGNWVIPGSYMHIDARRIKDLFLKHPNVKLCLSGHEHQIDEVRYNEVTYVCGGAVSAAWWGGNYFECTFGYNLVDLFEDGSFAVSYVPYGWKPKS